MGVQIPALNINNSQSKLEINGTENVFGQSFNETLIHQLITRFLAGRRAGTKAQKTRSEVSGGGAKPWRQKGTGRARSGTTRSPVWRTGGVAFAAKPRDYEQKLNKKMFRVGLRSILSELIRQERLLIVESLELGTNKTKDLVSKLSFIQAKRILIVVKDVDENLALASRNLINVEVCEASNLNPVLLLWADKTILTNEALVKVEEHLA